MKYLKKFFESRQSHKLTKEDLEDEFLELLDMNYIMDQFKIGYYDNERGIFEDMPKNGYHPAYSIWLRLPDDDDDDYYNDRKTLSEINKNIQNRYQNASKVLSALNSVQKRLGAEFYVNWSYEGSFGIYIVPKEAEPLEVSEKESDFYLFEGRVKGIITETLFREGEATFESKPEDFTIRVKFGDITTSRINTAIRNLDKLKGGVHRGRRTNVAYNFTATKVPQMGRISSSKELIIKFESKEATRR
jgi:hypothetical protein